MVERLRRLAGDAGEDKGLRKELREAGKAVAGDKVEIARDRAPERTGKLKRSGRVLVLVSPKKEEIRLTLVFGGELAPYAPIVHATHPTHANFLGSVILEAAGTGAEELARRIDLNRAAK